MIFRTLILSLWLVSANASFAPSVWEQMQTGDASGGVSGRILEIKGDTIEIQVKGSNPNHDEIRTVKLCMDSAENSARSEATGAVFLNQKLTRFEEAKKSKESVLLNFQGPWNPCLRDISAAN